MSYSPTADRGNWNVICDDCGKQYKASELRKRWDNLMVCTKTCYEERPMQDFVRAGVDHMEVPWSRPKTSDTFILGSFDVGFSIPGFDNYIPTPPAAHPLVAVTTTPAVNVGGSGYVVGDVISLGTATYGVTGVTGSGGITSIGPENTAYTATSSCVPGGTLDPSAHSSHITLTTGNLTASTDQTAVYQNAAGYYLSAGKRYYEVVFSGNVGTWSARRVGIGTSQASILDGALVGGDSHGFAYDNSALKSNFGNTSYGASWDGGDVIGVLWDADTGVVAFYKNGIPQGTAFTGVTGLYRPIISGYGLINATIGANFTVNFGASTWAYAPPAGYVGWNTNYMTTTGGTGTGAELACPVVATVNYSTLNPSASAPWLVISAWSLVAYTTNNLFGAVLSTVFQSTGVSKQLYCEIQVLAAPGGINIGLATSSFPWGADSVYIGITSDSYGYSPSGVKWNNNSSSGYGTAYGTNSIVGILFDASTGTLQFTVNGVSQGIAFTGLSGTFCPAISIVASHGNTTAFQINYGARAWNYVPPVGYIGWLA